MRDRYRLLGLHDDELVKALPKLASRERELTADLLAHLAELEARRLYDVMGFHSMWEYCIEALRMCRTTAWRKLTAARICYRFSGNFERIATGELQVAVVAELHKHLTEENGVELLAACIGKSFREVERLLAERFPKPDVCDSVRRLPRKAIPAVQAPNTLRAQASPSPSKTASTEARERPISVSEAIAEPAFEAPGVAAVVPHRQSARVEPLSLDRFAVRFTADAEFLALLEEVRGLRSHRGSEDLLSVLKLGLQAHRTELLKQRFAVGRTPRKGRASKVASPPKAQIPSRDHAEATPEGAAARRHVPAEVAREVFQRDGGQCAYVSPGGRRCSARRQLQIDHIQPHARQGGETVGNLRLLCQTHNQLAARLYFGRRYMRAVMKRVASRERTARRRTRDVRQDETLAESE